MAGISDIPSLSRRQLLKGGLAAGAVLAGFPASALARDGVAVRAAAAVAARRFTGAGGQWLEGDSHVHTDHSSDGSFARQTSDHRLPGNVSVADQIGYAELQGLDYLPLTDHRTHDQHYNPQWESARLLLITGEEANGSPHALAHGAVDMLVQGAPPPGDPGFRCLQQQVWDAHAQAALFGTAHPERDWSAGWPDGSPSERGNTVGIDFVEIWNRAQWPDRALDYSETLMNRGHRFAFVGGSDNHFRETWGVQGAGEPRTSVLVEGELSERALLDAVRAGHTRVRNDDISPDVEFRADFTGTGAFPTAAGDEVFVAAGTPGQLLVRISIGIPGDVVLVYRSPGREAGPLAEFPILADVTDAELVIDVEAGAEPSWYRVEVRGRGLPDSAQGLDMEAFTIGNLQRQVDGDQLRAVASPIFVSEGPVHPRPEIPLPPDQGADDGAAHVLGEPDGFAGFPAIAVAGGTTHVVAETHAPGSTTITYRRQLEPGGAWTEPVNLTPDSTTARFPCVAAQGHDVWVVWQDERAGQVPRRPAIYARHSADGGQTWQPERVVRAPDGRAWHPSLALTPEGQPVVAWAEIGADRPFDVWVQVLDVDDEPHNVSEPGKEFHPERPGDTRSARWPTSIHPAVAVAEDGTIAVAWQDNRDDPDPLFSGGPAEPPFTEPADGTDPDIWNIHLAERAPGTSAWSEPEVFGTADDVDADPALAWAPDGTLVLAWNSRPRQRSGVNFEIQAAHRGPDGWTGPAVVAPAPEFMGQRPQLGLDPDGSVRIAWYDTRSADWRWRVMTARLHDGQWAGATLLNGPGNNTWPAVDGGRIAFVSTRNAERLQRDKTHEVFIVDTAVG